MQTSYGCIFLKKSSVAAINITLGVPGRRADKTVEPPETADKSLYAPPRLIAYALSCYATPLASVSDPLCRRCFRALCPRR